MLFSRRKNRTETNSSVEPETLEHQMHKLIYFFLLNIFVSICFVFFLFSDDKARKGPTATPLRWAGKKTAKHTGRFGDQSAHFRTFNLMKHNSCFMQS